MKTINKNETIYTILENVSRSGMSRRIRCYIIKNGTLENVSQEIADVLHRPINYRGILCRGCGMDMGFELIYSFAQSVYEDGYAIHQQWI